ncbi:MAG: hypothetical protein IJO77_05715 [Oscillospiraceae bacterium]|nr:hypothetical protein [Oscillospiraceae bacterium]
MESAITLYNGGALTTKGKNYELTIPGAGTPIDLKRDVHFGKPNQKLKQPVLYKAGAEHIRIEYGVFDRYEILTKIEDWENGFFMYAFRCRLVKLNPIDGKEYVVTEGYGSANSRESSGGNASGFDLANQRLKIAEKRALVDAVIKLAGLSGAFTQDMDNDDFMSQATEIIKEKPDDPISAKQVKRIYAIAASVGLTQEQAKAKIVPMGYASTKNIKVKEYEGVCKAIEEAGKIA